MDANESVASSATEPLNDTPSFDQAAPATSQTEQAMGQPAESSTAQDTTETDDTSLPFHEHPRWQQVMAQNRELKEKAALAESLAPFAKLAELAKENGFESFEAMEQARQEMAAQAQAQAQEQATLSEIEQEIADGLDAYREELKEEGYDDPALVSRLLAGKQAELVAEASERLNNVHAHARAVEEAKSLLIGAPPEVLDIVKIFDAPSVPLVAKSLSAYIDSQVSARVAEWEAKRAEQATAATPLKGGGNVENSRPPATLDEIRNASWSSVFSRPQRTV